jgi:hypothetical protein
MMRRVSRSRVERLEQQLARLARAQARAPAGPQCALCGRLSDPGAPPWTAAGWLLTDGPGGIRLCALRCDAVGFVAYALAEDVSWYPCPNDTANDTTSEGCPYRASTPGGSGTCRRCFGLDHARHARLWAASLRALVDVTRADRRWLAVWWAVHVAPDEVRCTAAHLRAYGLGAGVGPPLVPPDDPRAVAEAQALEAWARVIEHIRLAVVQACRPLLPQALRAAVWLGTELGRGRDAAWLEAALLRGLIGRLLGLTGGAGAIGGAARAADGAGPDETDAITPTQAPAPPGWRQLGQQRLLAALSQPLPPAVAAALP